MQESPRKKNWKYSAKTLVSPSVRRETERARSGFGDNFFDLDLPQAGLYLMFQKRMVMLFVSYSVEKLVLHIIYALFYFEL